MEAYTEEFMEIMEDCGIVDESEVLRMKIFNVLVSQYENFLNISMGKKSMEEARTQAITDKIKLERLLEESIEKDTEPQLVKVLSGLSLVAKLEADALKERSDEKLQTANQLLDYILVPLEKELL